MRSVVLLCLVTSFVVIAPLAKAQSNLTTPEVTMVDTDGDGIADDEDACPTIAGPSSDDPKKNGCSAKTLAKQWIISFITKYAPPGRKQYYKNAVETKEDALVRYDGIADALVDTVYDPEVKPLFSGPQGRTQTISVLLGIMFWETSFRKDVDFALGASGRGDHGQSWCLMQIKVGDGRTADWNTRLNRPALKTDPPEDVHPGATGPELVHDRKLCIAEGIKVVRGSFGACRSLPLDERLSAYASGSCELGHEKSRQRINTGIHWFYNSQTQRLFKDEDLLQKPEDSDPVEKVAPKLAQG